jgi:protein-L-isoaspartate(D-aspartate) O-methyltransferase
MVTLTDHERLRREMVERQIKARGVTSPTVLEAMGNVRREGYLPSYLGEFAYEDTPLPIEEEQTISQPYIVAFMIEALDLAAGKRVLEIGTGSGYAAAVMAEIGAEVYTIERHERLATKAAERLARDGYTKVHVVHSDGTLGSPDAAPFDAIVVAAGGPEVPRALRNQLAVGGKLVIPVGGVIGLQTLKRITRLADGSFREEDLADVRFVPLVGAQGWRADKPARAAIARRPALSELVDECAEPIQSADDPGPTALGGLLERIGDARVVLLGEATHGTSEFYRLRAAITRELVTKKGFGIVAVEADWPDAALVDRYVRRVDSHESHANAAAPASKQHAFARFPTWMWRNTEVETFVEWLRDHNASAPIEKRVRFAGLDLYALFHSINAVIAYLETADPITARVARERYGCLTPWQSDPAAYGRAALTSAYRACEKPVVRMLADLLAARIAHATTDEPFFDALQNARLVADAENYYRTMYYGAHASWNLRDRHMFRTLEALLEHHDSASGDASSKVVVWEHNSHVGDASATDMAARGELNVGQLCRQRFGKSAYSIGFGTDRGTVAAASHWDGPMEVKMVRPSNERSYEWIFHASRSHAFLLALRDPRKHEMRDELTEPRLERAIGVIYRPETELASHYFHAVLPYQFDEYVWLDETHAVEPLATRAAGAAGAVPDTYPFGL